MYKCTKGAEYRPLLLAPQMVLPEFIRNIPSETARDRTIFKYSIPAAVPPETPIIEINNLDLLQEVTPRSAFKRDKKSEKQQKFSFAIFSFPKTDDPSTATHFENNSGIPQYRIISDKSVLYKKLCAETDKPYCTHEIFTEKTILVLEFVGDIVPLGKRGEIPDLPFLGIFQEIIHEIFGKLENCFLFRLDKDSCRMYWPGIYVKKSEMEIPQDTLQKMLQEKIKEKNWDDVLVDVYKRGHVSLPFSWSVDAEKHKKSRVVFLAEYDQNGKALKTTYELHDLFEKVSVRNE